MYKVGYKLQGSDVQVSSFDITGVYYPLEPGEPYYTIIAFVVTEEGITTTEPHSTNLKTIESGGVKINFFSIGIVLPSFFANFPLTYSFSAPTSYAAGLLVINTQIGVVVTGIENTALGQLAEWSNKDSPTPKPAAVAHNAIYLAALGHKADIDGRATALTPGGWEYTKDISISTLSLKLQNSPSPSLTIGLSDIIPDDVDSVYYKAIFSTLARGGSIIMILYPYPSIIIEDSIAMIDIALRDGVTVVEDSISLTDYLPHDRNQDYIGIRDEVFVKKYIYRSDVIQITDEEIVIFVHISVTDSVEMSEEVPINVSFSVEESIEMEELPDVDYGFSSAVIRFTGSGGTIKFTGYREEIK